MSQRQAVADQLGKHWSELKQRVKSDPEKRTYKNKRVKKIVAVINFAKSKCTSEKVLFDGDLIYAYITCYTHMSLFRHQVFCPSSITSSRNQLNLKNQSPKNGKTNLATDGRHKSKTYLTNGTSFSLSMPEIYRNRSLEQFSSHNFTFCFVRLSFGRMWFSLLSSDMLSQSHTQSPTHCRDSHSLDIYRGRTVRK